MPEQKEQLYKVVRYFKSGHRRNIFRHVSLAVAQLHCNDKRTAGPRSFDGYTAEK
jgi:hypothetical protein